MNNIFKILLFIHIAFGILSLILGLYILLTKKADKNHKTIGNFYFASMLITALVSFPMSYLHPSYFLFIIGIFTTYMLLTGRRYLQKKQITDVKNTDWILTFVMLITGIAFIFFGIFKLYIGDYFGTVFITFGAISIFFTWQDKRNFKGNSRYKNFGLTTHIQRMVASYIATLTAFLVVNNKFLPETIAWLLPTFLFVPLIIKWTKKYHIKKAE